MHGSFPLPILRVNNVSIPSQSAIHPEHDSKALRHKDLEENARQSNKDLYKEADTKYGHKFFLSLGKKLEVIIPFRGPGARFIMTDRLMRYLVAVLLPGERCTYEEFLHRLYQHYGIAVEGEYLTDAAI